MNETLFALGNKKQNLQKLNSQNRLKDGSNPSKKRKQTLKQKQSLNSSLQKKWLVECICNMNVKTVLSG